MSEADNKPVSDLAKAVLAGERITSSTGVDKASGVPVTGINNVPKGAVPITEGAIRVTDGKPALNESRQTASDGGVPVNFSKDSEKKSNTDKE